MPKLGTLHDNDKNSFKEVIDDGTTQIARRVTMISHSSQSTNLDQILVQVALGNEALFLFDYEYVNLYDSNGFILTGLI